MSTDTIDIAGRLIGREHPCFIIAEAGVNHNGSIDRALAMVEAAAACGADAVKFQSFRSEKLVTPQAPKAGYQLQTTDPGQSQLDMIRALELNEQEHRRLAERCRQVGIMFLSTPFDRQSADMLVEVRAAVAVLQGSGCPAVVLLHCLSNYPADPAQVNLRAMLTMAQAFGLPVGYSDHTLGLEVPLAAVALGACIIEKHFTLDRDLPGPDHQASASTQELAALVAGIRKVESALGHGRKEPASSEASTSQVARRSLVAAADLPAGAVLDQGMLKARRPGTGISPAQMQLVLGRRLLRPLPADSLLSWEDLA